VEPVSRTVVDRIHHLRMHRGMSARVLAEAISARGYHIKRTTLANQESGRVQTVSIDFVVHAAVVLGVPVDQLVHGFACNTCAGSPPPGFTCNGCGAGRTPTLPDA